MNDKNALTHTKAHTHTHTHTHTLTHTDTHLSLKSPVRLSSSEPPSSCPSASLNLSLRTLFSAFAICMKSSSSSLSGSSKSKSSSRAATISGSQSSLGPETQSKDSDHPWSWVHQSMVLFARQKQQNKLVVQSSESLGLQILWQKLAVMHYINNNITHFTISKGIVQVTVSTALQNDTIMFFLLEKELNVWTAWTTLRTNTYPC